MTTEDEYAAFLKQQVLSLFYPDGMTPEEAEEFEAYGRLRAVMDAEDEAFREAMRARMRLVAAAMPDLLREKGYDVPEELTFTIEEKS